jgi:2',3'-cyclic-nucleotide 2'-phosphodiesterase (5'-nucleotidase family)
VRQPALLASCWHRTSARAATRRIVILHTNDTHSRIDPFPEDGGRFAGLGGAARRASLVRDIRRRNPNALLLDSGDIFQGTPYFNFFGGEIEFKTMSSMRYDVATLGNHDFDNGVEHLAEMMPHADFEFVSANYDVEGTSLVQTSIRTRSGRSTASRSASSVSESISPARDAGTPRRRFVSRSRPSLRNRRSTRSAGRVVIS